MKRKQWLYSLIFVLLIGLTVFTICSQSASFTREGFWEYVRAAHPAGLAAAALCTLLYILLEGLALLAICRALGYRRSVGQGVLYSAADIYFSAITPSATGGQPASAVLMMRSGIPAAPTQQLSSCSIAVQQMVAIARAVDMECKVLILDEPTSSLDEQEVEKLFKLMLDLKSRGVGIIFVTHFLEQVYAVCDRITVLRDGKLVGEYKIADLPRVQLVSKMLGKELDDLSEIKSEGAADALDGAQVVYEAAGLSSAAGVRPFDFSIRKGEVNGFTGLLGSGRSESVRAIFGADHVSGGTVKMDGRQVKITSPLRAMKHGISYLPEDRKRDGIIGDLSVRDNIILARQVLDGFFHPISRAKAEQYAEEYIKLLNIKTASTDTPIKALSGGNQQKVILARWLLANPVYMILDEPTRIDVGTKVEIQKLVLQLAAEGKSVTFISSEIDEMLRVCSRLIVMRDRQVVGELRGSDLNQSSIMKTIAGGEQA